MNNVRSKSMRKEDLEKYLPLNIINLINTISPNISNIHKYDIGYTFYLLKSALENTTDQLVSVESDLKDIERKFKYAKAIIAELIVIILILVITIFVITK